MHGYRLVALACLAEIPLLLSCHQEPLARYGPVDRPYVERAVSVYSAHGNRSTEEIMKMFDPAVVYLPHMVCVGMNPRRGVLGGSTTICFDEGGREVLRYRNGD